MRSFLVFLAHIAILSVVANAAKLSNSPNAACNDIKKLENKLDKLAQNLGEKLENLTALISKTSTPGKKSKIFQHKVLA